MSTNLQSTLATEPLFLSLRAKRSKLAWGLSILTLLVYYGFIALIAFAPEILSERLGDGVITLGIPVGLGIILFSFIVTGIYVYKANSEFDNLTKQIREKLKERT